jgi:predicted TIM-barrel fold metal-dependent hydrolase
MGDGSAGSIERLPLSHWAPVAQVRLPSTPITRPAVPAIDVHNHLGRWLSPGDWEAGESPWMIPDVPALLEVMDAHDVELVVNLDGMWGDELTANVERYDAAYPGRFVTFCQIDWRELATPGGTGRLRRELARSRERGARGIKVWKNLGLWVSDADGSLVMPDDPRVVDVLGYAGELDLPVLIHVADPRAFFAPLDRHNERLDELRNAPHWWFGDLARYPTFERLLDGLRSLVLQTPGTRYVGAHVGCDAESLDAVESLLAAAPGFAVDIAGRMAEIGRQPRRFRQLVERFPDRVLFGTDVYPATAEQYELHFRFLESDDESFPYAPGAPIPPQGRWTVSALDLPRRLLPAVYSGNARRFLGLDG